MYAHRVCYTLVYINVLLLSLPYYASMTQQGWAYFLSNQLSHP